MIMRIRVDEPFTLPRTLKDITIKNMELIRNYFNKQIRNADGSIYCTLNTNSIDKNKALETLVEEIDQMLFNKPFEAYCITRTDNPDRITEKGLPIPAASTFARKICKLLNEKGLNKSQLDSVRELIIAGNYNPKINFFMPCTHDYSTSHDYIYFGGEQAVSVFNEQMPEILELLKEQQTPYLIKCIIRYNNFNKEDRNEFIIELIKHSFYSIVSDYDYPIKFKSSTAYRINANRIISIKEI